MIRISRVRGKNLLYLRQSNPIRRGQNIQFTLHEFGDFRKFFKNKSVAHKSELHLFPNEERETQVTEFSDDDAESVEDYEDEEDESLPSTSIYELRKLCNKKHPNTRNDKEKSIRI